jgi:hypothetical protein
MRWARYVARRRYETLTKFWPENMKGRGPLGRRRRREENNIKMDLEEVWCEGWADFVWFRAGSCVGIL